MGSSSVDRESHTNPKFLCRDWDVLSSIFNEAVVASRSPHRLRTTRRSTLSTLSGQSAAVVPVLGLSLSDARTGGAQPPRTR